jgi:hypothetical protein
MSLVVLLVMLGCESTTPKPAPEQVPPKEAEVVGTHTGIQHPPIPADSPAWRHDPGGFVPDVRFYGERTWDDVRMRLAGHIGVIERDRARAAATASRFKAGAEIYRSLAADMDKLSGSGEGPSAKIPGLIRDAAIRDAAVLDSLSTMPTAAGRTSSKAIDIAAFEDFDDRHQLRVALWSAYLATTDPVSVDNPWGYFDPQSPAPAPALFSVEGLGGMPTGDTLIDVAGEPGPKAIGRLEKLSLEDPKHRQWVEDTVYVLNKKLAESPGAIVSLIKSRVDQLEHFRHGSRYYNIKQLRNEGVRVLARGGHYGFARQILAMNFPLHHQDWECPNREGILVAIDARLAMLDGDPKAEARLIEARQITDAFLAKVNQADRD